MVTAGTLIRAERERRGLRLDVLAATLKVGVFKLQALEEDRFDELPDAAFTRALAMSVCRVMGVDAAPVLALLPRADGSPEALEHVTSGLQEPFDARASHGWVGLAIALGDGCRCGDGDRPVRGLAVVVLALAATRRETADACRGVSAACCEFLAVRVAGVGAFGGAVGRCGGGTRPPWSRSGAIGGRGARDGVRAHPSCGFRRVACVRRPRDCPHLGRTA
jgi:hypothetical protein